MTDRRVVRPNRLPLGRRSFHGPLRVEVEEECGAFADDVAEGPQASQGFADDQRGQGQHVEEIRRGEVGHVDERAAPAARPAAHAPQQETVQTQAQQKGEAVGHGLKDPLVVTGHRTDFKGLHSKDQTKRFNKRRPVT